MSMGFDPTQDAPFDDGSGFAMDDIDPDKPGSGGGGKLPEGSYCVGITEVNLKNERGSTEVKCEVVAAKDQNLLGHSHTEYLKWPKPTYTENGNRISKEQLIAWCYAAKTTSPEEIKARQQARQGFNPAWLETMVGKFVLIVVKHDAYKDEAGNDKSSAKVDGRVWAVDNPKGKGIPGWVDVSGQRQPAAAQQTAQQSQQQQAASDPFAGLV